LKGFGKGLTPLLSPFLISIPMAIFRALMDDVIEKYTQFKPSDDLAVPEDFIANKIHTVRATLISQLAKQ
jgi:hypothetical protein